MTKTAFLRTCAYSIPMAIYAAELAKISRATIDLWLLAYVTAAGSNHLAITI